MNKKIKELIQFLKNKFKKTPLISSSNEKVDSSCETKTKYDTILDKIDYVGLQSEYNKKVKENNINIDKLMIDYMSRLVGDEPLYDVELSTKLSRDDTLSLANEFFDTLSQEFSEEAKYILSGHFDQTGIQLNLEDASCDKSRKAKTVINEDYTVTVDVPFKGDLRDLYNIVHQMGHTLDSNQGLNDTRKLLGGVVPECLEKMLDDFLTGLPESKKSSYKIDPATLSRDVGKRKIAKFLDTFASISKNDTNGARNLISCLYSSQLQKTNSVEDKCEKMSKFNYYVTNDDFEKASETLGMDLSKGREFYRNLYLDDTVEEIAKIISIADIRKDKDMKLGKYKEMTITTEIVNDKQDSEIEPKDTDDIAI